MGFSAVLIGMLALTTVAWASSDLDYLQRLGGDPVSRQAGVERVVEARSSWREDFARNYDDAFLVVLAVIAATSGVLFAVSGIGSGGLGLLLTVLISLGLYQTHTKYSFILMFDDFSESYQFEPTQESNHFPSHVDGIRVY